MADLRQQLQSRLQGRVCLVGIGNLEYGDDGFGVRLAERLAASGVSDVIVAATSPERYIGQVVEQGFHHLVFLDAVDFGASPGSAVFLDASEIAARFPQISTHKISLGSLAQWAQADGTTKSWLLGVQPESLGTGQQLTPTVTTTLEALEELLRALKPSADARSSPAARSGAEVNA